VEQGAGQFVYGGTASGGSVFGYQEIDSGGTASNVEVGSGGTQTVMSGGTAVDTELNGGHEIVSAGGTASGMLTFGIAGGGLTLQSGAIFNGELSGLAADGWIDLAAVTYASATVTYSSTQGVLTVTDGAHSVALTLLGQYMAAGFHSAKDGTGGTIITYTPTTSSAQLAVLAPGH
jgi:autotransporter passenger strand-loop-strand repeat protein